MNGTAREMTLDEWVDRLPKVHGARDELAALRARVEKLEEALRPFAVSGWDLCSDNVDGEMFLGADAVSLGHVATARRLLGMEVEP